jgi:histone-binding protein RBBP4
MFLSGSDDKDVVLWDMRKLTKRIQKFSCHDNSVLKVQWSPFHVGIFGSSGADRRMYIWDLSKCNET